MHKKQGFTLIELLVVVLIIGILSAVALPQYQRMILKTRYVHVQSAADTLARSQQRYYLANGVYSENMEDLDVLPAGCRIIQNGGQCVTKNFNCFLQPYCCVKMNGYPLCHSVNGTNRYCMAVRNNGNANVVCKSMGGVFQASMNWNSFNYYLLP